MPPVGTAQRSVVLFFFQNARHAEPRRATFQIILIQDATASHAWQTWKLIPVNVEGTLTPAQLLSDTLGSGSLPPYCDGHPTGQTSTTHVQRDDSERDEFGTMVNEVTVVTTTSTVTTRKRYRVVE